MANEYRLALSIYSTLSGDRPLLLVVDHDVFVCRNSRFPALLCLVNALFLNHRNACQTTTFIYRLWKHVSPNHLVTYTVHCVKCQVCKMLSDRRCLDLRIDWQWRFIAEMVFFFVLWLKCELRVSCNHVHNPSRHAGKFVWTDWCYFLFLQRSWSHWGFMDL